MYVVDSHDVDEAIISFLVVSTTARTNILLQIHLRLFVRRHTAIIEWEIIVILAESNRFHLARNGLCFIISYETLKTNLNAQDLIW